MTVDSFTMLMDMSSSEGVVDFLFEIFSKCKPG